MNLNSVSEEKKKQMLALLEAKTRELLGIDDTSFIVE
jgi:hypothetical protein